MSDQYDNTNSGAIFKNDKKETDSHPDYKGSINAEGKDYWASVWINKSKEGKSYMSVKLTAKDAVQSQAPKATQVSNEPSLDDDSIPF